MGKYVSLTFSISTPLRSGVLVDALCANDDVTLVAVGGRLADDYFVAGYALESFASHYLDVPGAKRPRSVDVHTGLDAENAYLAEIVDAMKQKRSLRHALSKFEREDAVARVTVIDDASLEREVSSAVQAWNAKYPYGVVQFYCSMALAIGSEMRAAFRDLYDHTERKLAGVGFPIVSIAIDGSPNEPGVTRISLSSRSHVWLREGEATRSGRTGVDDAELNLISLARLGGTLATVGELQEPPSLKLDGTSFTREADRIYKAFSERIPNLPDDLTW